MSIVPLSAAIDPSVYGGKASQLAAALRAGLPVPPGFAVSVAALDGVKRGERSAQARAEAVFGELDAAIAVRSSAIGEDGAEASFAGQHLTCLNVTTAAAAIEALVRVHDSAHAAAALAYREQKGIVGPIQVAAVMQRLVDSSCAGVLFTRNPVTGADERVIEAAWGLGEAVVAGLVTPDHHRVARDGRVLATRIGDKDLAVRRDPNGGTREVELEPELAARPCLDAAGLARLNELATRAETHFGHALDLEWALVNDTLYLLQARPISTGNA